MNDILEILNQLTLGNLTENEAAKQIYKVKMPKKVDSFDTFFKLTKNKLMQSKVKLITQFIISIIGILLNVTLTCIAIYTFIILIKIFG